MITDEFLLDMDNTPKKEFESTDVNPLGLTPLKPQTPCRTPQRTPMQCFTPLSDVSPFGAMNFTPLHAVNTISKQVQKVPSKKSLLCQKYASRISKTYLNRSNSIDSYKIPTKEKLVKNAKLAITPLMMNLSIIGVAWMVERDNYLESVPEIFNTLFKSYNKEDEIDDSLQDIIKTDEEFRNILSSYEPSIENFISNLPEWNKVKNILTRNENSLAKSIDMSSIAMNAFDDISFADITTNTEYINTSKKRYIREIPSKNNSPEFKKSSSVSLITFADEKQNISPIKSSKNIHLQQYLPSQINKLIKKKPKSVKYKLKKFKYIYLYENLRCKNINQEKKMNFLFLYNHKFNKCLYFKKEMDQSGDEIIANNFLAIKKKYILNYNCLNKKSYYVQNNTDMSRNLLNINSIILKYDKNILQNTKYLNYILNYLPVKHKHVLLNKKIFVQKYLFSVKHLNTQSKELTDKSITLYNNAYNQTKQINSNMKSVNYYIKSRLQNIFLIKKHNISTKLGFFKPISQDLYKFKLNDFLFANLSTNKDCIKKKNPKKREQNPFKNTEENNSNKKKVNRLDDIGELPSKLKALDVLGNSNSSNIKRNLISNETKKSKSSRTNISSCDFTTTKYESNMKSDLQKKVNENQKSKTHVNEPVLNISRLTKQCKPDVQLTSSLLTNSVYHERPQFGNSLTKTKSLNKKEYKRKLDKIDKTNKSLSLKDKIPSKSIPKKDPDYPIESDISLSEHLLANEYIISEDINLQNNQVYSNKNTTLTEVQENNSNIIKKNNSSLDSEPIKNIVDEVQKQYIRNKSSNRRKSTSSRSSSNLTTPSQGLISCPPLDDTDSCFNKGTKRIKDHRLLSLNSLSNSIKFPTYKKFIDRDILQFFHSIWEIPIEAISDILPYTSEILQEMWLRTESQSSVKDGIYSKLIHTLISHYDPIYAEKAVAVDLINDLGFFASKSSFLYINDSYKYKSTLKYKNSNKDLKIYQRKSTISSGIDQSHIYNFSSSLNNICTNKKMSNQDISQYDILNHQKHNVKKIERTNKKVVFTDSLYKNDVFFASCGTSQIEQLQELLKSMTAAGASDVESYMKILQQKQSIENISKIADIEEIPKEKNNINHNKSDSLSFKLEQYCNKWPKLLNRLSSRQYLINTILRIAVCIYPTLSTKRNNCPWILDINIKKALDIASGNIYQLRKKSIQLKSIPVASQNLLELEALQSVLASATVVPACRGTDPLMSSSEMTELERTELRYAQRARRAARQNLSSNKSPALDYSPLNSYQGFPRKTGMKRSRIETSSPLINKRPRQSNLRISQKLSLHEDFPEEEQLVSNNVSTVNIAPVTTVQEARNEGLLSDSDNDSADHSPSGVSEIEDPLDIWKDIDQSENCFRSNRVSGTGHISTPMPGIALVAPTAPQRLQPGEISMKPDLLSASPVETQRLVHGCPITPLSEFHTNGYDCRLLSQNSNVIGNQLYPQSPKPNSSFLSPDPTNYERYPGSSCYHTDSSYLSYSCEKDSDYPNNVNSEDGLCSTESSSRERNNKSISTPQPNVEFDYRAHVRGFEEKLLPTPVMQGIPNIFAKKVNSYVSKTTTQVGSIWENTEWPGGDIPLRGFTPQPSISGPSNSGTRAYLHNER